MKLLYSFGRSPVVFSSFQLQCSVSSVLFLFRRRAHSAAHEEQAPHVVVGRNEAGGTARSDQARAGPTYVSHVLHRTAPPSPRMLSALQSIIIYSLPIPG